MLDKRQYSYMAFTSTACKCHVTIDAPACALVRVPTGMELQTDGSRVRVPDREISRSTVHNKTFYSFSAGSSSTLDVTTLDVKF